MDTLGWIAARRDDGETVGYLEPLADDYSVVQPRSLLGHRTGGPTDIASGEERLADWGISELAERWHLRDAPPGLRGGVAILEVSPAGIVVAHADLAKASAGGPKATVPWPDVAGRLRAAGPRDPSGQPR